MGIESYRDLVVWQKAMDAAEEIYRLVRKLPKEELYGLTSQVRRSVAAIPSNVAEGHGRSSRKEYAYFISVAKGSTMETQTFIELTVRLGYLQKSEISSAVALLDEIERMLRALHERLTEQ